MALAQRARPDKGPSGAHSVQLSNHDVASLRYVCKHLSRLANKLSWPGCRWCTGAPVWCGCVCPLKTSRQHSSTTTHATHTKPSFSTITTPSSNHLIYIRVNDITLFRSITLFYGTTTIVNSVLHIQSE